MLSVVIQAGGQSRRMGRDKALVPLRGKPLIGYVLDKVTGLGDEILITTNTPEEYEFLPFPKFRDKHPGAGALSGLSTALLAARGEDVLLLACDLPFLERGLLEKLIRLAGSADVIVPEWEGKYEPLVAVYSLGCLDAVRHALQRGEMRMISFFPQVKVRVLRQIEIAELDPAGTSFFNINSPEDLLEAERRLDQAS